MGNVFGKSKKKQNSRITDNDRAVLELKKARDQLHVYQKKILADLDRERNVAKQLLQQEKPERAKAVLRRKRYKESLLEKCDNQIDNLDTMVNQIEQAEVQIKVVDGIKAGKAALDKLHEVLKLDDIEQLMDDTREAVQLQQQIEDTIAGSLSPDEEQQALDELEALLAADDAMAAQEIQPGSGDTVPELPQVPDHELPSPQKDSQKSRSQRAAVAE